MSSHPSGSTLREIETLFQVGAVGALGDAELLERFVSRRGEEAEAVFAEIVRRHGPMVLRACRRLLDDPDDAEDAFQATFLVLARKARAVARRERLAGWLYGVAVRVAKELKAGNARRRAREGGLAGRPGDLGPATAGPAAEDDWPAILDEELGRLPERLRAPVVLCDLEGRTHREAALALGLPVGTVSSRLVRARERLRSRLVRRGLTLSAGGLGATFAREAAAAAGTVPAPLVARTCRAAAGAAAPSTILLAEGVLRTMLVGKLTSKGVLLALALAAAAAAGVGLARRGRSMRADEAPSPMGTTPKDEDWSWIDGLTNADEATRRRLGRCIRAVHRNFAAIRQLSFDFDLTRQRPAVGEPRRAEPETLTYKGRVFWRQGAVRYDFDGDSPVDMLGEQGRPLPRGEGTYGVIRTADLLAAIEDSPTWGVVLNIEAPPKSEDDWWQQSATRLSHLDPLLHHAAFFGPAAARLRADCRACTRIESSEEGGKVRLRLVRANNSWVEVVCDPAADDLPVRVRAGGVRDGKPIAYVGADDTLEKVDGVWYPVRHIEWQLGGGEPTRDYDLTARNLRINDAARVPGSAFDVADLPLPEGAGGSDFRTSPARSLVKAGGLLRERRPTERPVRVERPAPARSAPAAASRGARDDYRALVSAYDAARRDAERAATAADDLRARLRADARVEARFAGRFLEFADRHPRDPAAVDALAGVVTNRFTPRETSRAAEILARDHIESGALVPLYRQLGDPPLALSPGGEALLRAGLGRGPGREARGRACLGLALLLKNRAAALRELRGPAPDLLLRFTAEANGIDPRDPEPLEEEAVRLFDRVVAEFADVPGDRGPLGDVARDERFRLRDLAVGRVAPEVEGRDVDGRPFRLGDYRGKVVVLTFSGNWCGPCRAMYPHERDLVARMAGKPFALLSVNTDEDPEALRKSIATGEITWRCWWEGGADRPNCARYRVRQFPTILVLGPDGVIRAKDVRGKALDEAVEKLVDRQAAR
ncbi:MAG TPA: sigma-70 family RNA polymerase sigma factor [Isosphaeraceae bacterium]|jgi:RNA polymerase sigma factor (sigma-70 family)|nr:sigma-70 family RNA polymerase sigma factor [Isosphaeraceae bacterium]